MNIEKIEQARQQVSITPSGFFGTSSENIVEIKNFITKEEQKKLIEFSLNNTIWDKTIDHVDEDGLVLYQASIWDNRVCTYNSLMKSDPSILKLIYSMINRLKVEIDKFFNVEAQETGPAIVRWPVGSRQEPHADKEFWIGEEIGRPNDFPWYDIASLFYFNDDYEGGELSFPKLNISVKPQAGDLFIFPSTYIYSHVAEPVLSGIKYSMVTMLDYNDHAHNKEYYSLRDRLMNKNNV